MSTPSTAICTTINSSSHFYEKSESQGAMSFVCELKINLGIIIIIFAYYNKISKPLVFYNMYKIVNVLKLSQTTTHKKNLPRNLHENVLALCLKNSLVFVER